MLTTRTSNDGPWIHETSMPVGLMLDFEALCVAAPNLEATPAQQYRAFLPNDVAKPKMKKVERHQYSLGRGPKGNMNIRFLHPGSKAQDRRGISDISTCKILMIFLLCEVLLLPCSFTS